MKKILISIVLLIISITSYSQYAKYYSDCYYVEYDVKTDSFIKILNEAIIIIEWKYKIIDNIDDVSKVTFPGGSFKSNGKKSTFYKYDKEREISIFLMEGIDELGNNVFMEIFSKGEKVLSFIIKYKNINYGMAVNLDNFYNLQ